MILANVAAAEELERLHLPAMYRIHAPPNDEKLASLRSFLHGLGDPELEARYREWLPVLEIDGQRAFVYYLDEAAVKKKLSQSP